MLRNLNLLFIAGAAYKKTLVFAENCSTVSPEEILSQEILEEICQGEAINASNKPTFLRVGAQYNMVVPISCLSGYDNKCEPEVAIWDAFLKNNDNSKKLDDARGQQNARWIKWQSETKTKFSQLSVSSFFQQSNTNILFSNLEVLRLAFLKMQTIIEDKIGNCGEQNMMAAIKILEQAQKHNLKLTIQTVILRAEPNLGYVNDHMFLVINGGLSVVDIQDDSIKTWTYLRSLKKSSGFICDRWNQGLLTKASDDETYLYHTTTFWSSVKVDTFDFDFSKLKTLPVSLQKIFCEELEKMNLSKDSAETCDRVLKI